MNSILLSIVGLIYIILAINYFITGHIGLGITFVAYAVANAGLYLAGTNV